MTGPELPGSAHQPRMVGEPEVGAFRQGTQGSRWLLSRYLVGRVIGEYVNAALVTVALVVFGVAVLVYVVAPTWIAIVIGLIGVGVLLARAVFGGVMRRVTAATAFASVEDRMSGLVADTRSDVRRELSRVGLPSTVWTMPLLLWRLRGRRRADTMQRLRRFDVEQVVPAARVDDLHLALRTAADSRR